MTHYSEELTGIAMTLDEHVELLDWAARRGLFASIAPDHEGFEELGEIYQMRVPAFSATARDRLPRCTKDILDEGGQLIWIVSKHAGTGEIIVDGIEAGREIVRAGSMTDALAAL
jgi:hypothetical protein